MIEHYLEDPKNFGHTKRANIRVSYNEESSLQRLRNKFLGEGHPDATVKNVCNSLVERRPVGLIPYLEHFVKYFRMETSFERLWNDFMDAGLVDTCLNPIFNEMKEQNLLTEADDIDDVKFWVFSSEDWKLLPERFNTLLQYVGITK